MASQSQSAQSQESGSNNLLEATPAHVAARNRALRAARLSRTLGAIAGMGNFLTRTSFGLEGQVRIYRKQGEPCEFSVFPMVHAASTDFYAGVRDELEKCDLILFEGVRSAKARILVRAYEIAARSPRLDLNLQRKSLDLSEFRDRLIHADQDALAFEDQWSRLPWKVRLWVRFMAPLIGALGYVALTRETLAKILDASGLPARDYWADEREGESDVEKVTGGSRDQHILAQVQECYEDHGRLPIRVGVLFGASHAERVGGMLSGNLGFHVASATRLSVFEYDV